MPVSSVPLPADDGLRRIADLPLDEVAVHLLNSLFDKRKHVRLRDDLTELGNTLSPHELAELYKFIQSMTTEDGAAQIAAFAPMWSPLTNGTGAEYSREVLFDGTILFRSAVKAAVRPALVGFTSRLNGMFMSNCRFLEMLGRHPVDVVINSTESGTFGQWSLGGTRSFAGSLFILKRVLAARGITPRAYAGASAGCGPAVYAATLDPGTSAVLFGCRFYVPGVTFRWPRRVMLLSRSVTAGPDRCRKSIIPMENCNRLIRKITSVCKRLCRGYSRSRWQMTARIPQWSR